MLFDKFIYDTQEPKTQSVLWIRPQLGKEVTIEAFINGKWKTIGGGDPSKYLTKEAFEAFKATYNQTIDGLEHRITDLETVINRSSYVITLQKDPSTTGTVSGGGRFIAGTSVTVVATPDAQSDYPEFDGWYEGETKVSENASYTFTVSGARTLVAKFKEATPIEVSGQAQVFKDRYCSEYVDYTLNAPKLWVRINNYDANAWPYTANGDIVLRKSAGVLDIYDTVTSVAIYQSNVQPPFTAGQVIECSRVAEQTKFIENVYYYNGD